MAKRTIVTLVDDLDGKEAAETVTFTVDGATYEIDLTERNAAKFRRLLAPYIEAARKAKRGGKRKS